jgi:antitoxin CcdA
MRMEDARNGVGRPARKVATNLSVPADLIREAKSIGLNLSELLEVALREALRRKRQEAWLEENRDAIDSYNARVAREGTFSDAWRKF